MTTTSSIDTGAVRERLDGPRPPRLLDVRTPAEFAAVHIPGAVNVPLDALREHRDQLCRVLDGDAVVICRSGARSAQAADALAGHAPAGLHVLDGGMTAWEAAGGIVNRGRDRWDMERQVRFTAGALVLILLLADLLLPGLRWLAAGVGLGLVVAAATNSCAMGRVLAMMPWNRSRGHDVHAAIAQLAQGR